MENYYIVNRETQKLELHFEKSAYDALTDEQKKDIKSAFLWGRKSGCWISRAKEPNLYYPRRVAEKLGLTDAGKTGERLSFAEQMERKQERAERRADRYDGRADAAEKRGEALQKPINDMHGDIAFFTQPNINTSAGRAFTRRREKMFAAFDRGFDELRKSAYWQDRAEKARRTASGRELQDKAFVGRRIKECESDLRQLKKRVAEQEERFAKIDAGEAVTTYGGTTLTRENVEKWLDEYLDRMEAALDKLGFYQECMESLGGVQFSSENIKPGYIVRCQKYGRGEVVSVGPKNCTVLFGTDFPLTTAYAEIIEIIEAKEKKDAGHPFRVGDTFTCGRWNSEKRAAERVTYTVIKTTEKSITLQTGDEKPIMRKPTHAPWDLKNWRVTVTDWNDGTWIKQPAALTLDEFADRYAGE